MNDPVRIWVPMAAWWVPVWITLDTAGESTDALETAVIGLVHAGLVAPDALARELCLDRALVESAVATLTAAGVLTATEGGLMAKPTPEAGEGPRARAGFVAWDPASQRPLLQLWLDRDLPEMPVRCPEGWRIAPWAEPDPYPSRPRDQEVAEELRVLPGVGDLRIYEPRGLGAHESDGARVRRLRRRTGPSLRGPIWAPVEQRVAGPVVWRPSLLPLPEVSTELDPSGVQGVERGITPDAQGVLREVEAAHRDRIAPGLIRAAGFASVEDLQTSAREEAARELGGISEMPEWGGVLRLVEDAIVDEHVSRAVGGDWRRPLRAWGDVFERLTRDFARRLRPVVLGLKAGRLEADGRSRLRPVLGDSTGRVLDVASQPAELAKLCASLARDMDSIGTRVLALGVCVALDPRIRRAFEVLCLDTPKLFDSLDTAKDERNRVVHPKEGAEEIGILGHRARVLLACRMLPRLELPAAPLQR